MYYGASFIIANREFKKVKFCNSCPTHICQQLSKYLSGWKTTAAVRNSMARQHQLLQSSSSPSSTTLIFCLLPIGTKIFSIWANAVSIRRNTKSTTLTNWRRTFQNLHSSSSNLLWITMIFVGKTASQHWVNRKGDSQWPVRAYKAPVGVTVIVFWIIGSPKHQFSFGLLPLLVGY